MKHDQYLTDMRDGVDAAHKNLWAQRPVTITETVQLYKSINATADLERMKDDTLFRTNGQAGVNKTERINGIAESFHQLNRGRDSG